VTIDGVEVALFMNAGLRADLSHLDETGAQGIGLFRTELQFMINANMPRLNVQAELYSDVLKAAGPRPVVFRSLDLGGDKVLPYGQAIREENPAMGWRAIRIALDRPALLRYQTRALLLGSTDRDLNIMFPMIAEVDEFLRAKELVSREVERLKRTGRNGPRKLRLGTMIEVPSLLFQLPQLLKHVDFVSVGTNDLVQFFFASDRGNPRLGERYDVLSVAVLRAMADVASQCRVRNIPATVCGEMAGRPLEAMALIAIGYRILSMPPSSLGPVKAMIRSLHVGRLRERLGSWLDGTAHTLRDDLKAFAESEGVQL
jgi:phosphotransferase system enzyme I (PtsP)